VVYVKPGQGQIEQIGEERGDFYADYADFTDWEGGSGERVDGEDFGGGDGVHREIGPGFLESIYQRALRHELGLVSMSVEAEVDYPVMYKGKLVGRHRVDLIVEQMVVLELKASPTINQAHIAQTLSYLKATRLELALVLNFGTPSLQWKRLIRSRPASKTTEHLPNPPPSA
jgi:GxxExxY protein